MGFVDGFEAINYMEILAYIALGLNIINVLCLPLLIGKARESYSYSNFISAVLSLIIVFLLAGRVIGWF